MRERFTGQKLQKYLWITPAAAGLAIWHSWGSPLATLLSNVFFMIGVWFLICGLWKLANNLGLFHSVRYGSRRFFQVILEHTAFAEKLPKTGDYISYLREFQPDDTYPALLLLSGGMLAAALIFCFF